MLLDHCLPVSPVCDVGVLWPNGWMDQHATWCGGRPPPWPHCVRWGPNSLKGHNNQTKRLATSLRQKYFEKHIKSLHTLDPHSWWSKIKHFLHPVHSNPLRCLQDSDSDVTLAESINDFFVSISAALPPLDSNTLLNLDSDYTPNFIIDPVDIDARLAGIKIHKAPGPDGIPNWLLRDFSSLLCQPLAAIFNTSIREGYSPPYGNPQK